MLVFFRIRRWFVFFQPISIHFLTFLVTTLPFGKPPIIGKTGATERLAEVTLLLVVRHEFYLMGYGYHSLLSKFSATALFTSSNSFLFLLLLLPYRRAENTVMISRTSFASSSSNLTFSSPLLIIITSTSLASQMANTSSAPKRSSLSLCVKTNLLTCPSRLPEQLIYHFQLSGKTDKKLVVLSHTSPSYDWLKRKSESQRSSFHTSLPSARQYR